VSKPIDAAPPFWSLVGFGLLGVLPAGKSAGSPASLAAATVANTDLHPLGFYVLTNVRDGGCRPQIVSRLIIRRPAPSAGDARADRETAARGMIQ
jgi:hypothetical protein